MASHHPQSGPATAQPHSGKRGGVLPIRSDIMARIMDDRAAAGLVDERIDLIEQLRVNKTLAPVSLLDDLSDFAAEVRSSPASHALVALAGFLAGLLLVIVPALVGAAVL